MDLWFFENHDIGNDDDVGNNGIRFSIRFTLMDETTYIFFV